MKINEQIVRSFLSDLKEGYSWEQDNPFDALIESLLAGSTPVRTPVEIKMQSPYISSNERRKRATWMGGAVGIPT